MENTGQALYRQAKKLIPGGTQLLSKRPEFILPDLWPAYYTKVKGVEVWDLDGKKYVDMFQNGVGTCVLGAADPDVNAAVMHAVDNGSMSTLNSPEEVELAEILCELHPWASMVRYARCGGEVLAIAVRIARAHTKKDKIAFCGYHGWHDWYLAANLADDHTLDGHLLPGLDPTGVPRQLAGTALPFRFNHLEELEAIIEKHGKEIGTIVMEPLRTADPAPGFLEGVRAIATKIGAILIFDEVTSGFRLNAGGAHLLLGVEPDMAVFAKGMSNGYPMAAVIGRGDVMNTAQDSFISSTYWTERIGFAAAVATIKKFREKNVHEHLIRIGTLVQEGWKKTAEETGCPVHVSGIAPLSHFGVECDDPLAAKTLFTQILLEEGFLAGSLFYATYAHTEDHVESYMKAVKKAFAVIAKALKEGNLKAQLQGGVAHAGFYRLA